MLGRLKFLGIVHRELVAVERIGLRRRRETADGGRPENVGAFEFGDETDYGLNFGGKGSLLRVTLGSY